MVANAGLWDSVSNQLMYLLQASTVFKFNSCPYPFLWEVLTKTLYPLSLQQEVVPFSLGSRGYFKRRQLLDSLKKILHSLGKSTPILSGG